MFYMYPPPKLKIMKKTSSALPPISVGVWFGLVPLGWIIIWVWLGQVVELGWVRWLGWIRLGGVGPVRMDGQVVGSGQVVGLGWAWWSCRVGSGRVGLGRVVGSRRVGWLGGWVRLGQVVGLVLISLSFKFHKYPTCLS